MHLSQIVLRDWKAYTSATFDFPGPGPERNIVLIGAPNGYGKTSLFEAIVLGMFGRDGLQLVARSPLAGSDKERLATSYRDFLERALHRGALDAGRTSCSVKLVFMDENFEPLEIQRVWHFSESGVYRPGDEEVYIYEGVTRRPIGPGSLSVIERNEFFREYISENLLPFTLAHFFMFDGEQVSALAEREMSAQVRLGIEGMLGLPVLKQLAKDLRSYAEVRRRENPQISDKTIERIELDRHQLTFELEGRRRRLEEIEPTVIALKEEREALTRELLSYGAGSQALLQEQFEQIKGLERRIEQDEAELEGLLIKDLALALSGKPLREALRARLVGENVRERWESGRLQGDGNLDRFLASIKSGLSVVEPAITSDQQLQIVDLAIAAWEMLWHPAPSGSAEFILHSYLSESDRVKIIEELDKLEELGASNVMDLVSSISENKQSLARLQEEVTKKEAVAPHIDRKRERLSSLNSEIQVFDQDIGGLRREIAALEAQIHQKNLDLTKLAGQWDRAKPSVRRAMRALNVAAMLDEIIEQAVPSQIQAIAKAMTYAHKSMAHKKDQVVDIDIDPECNVRLLNASGVDLRGFDLSAGEKQIFTQALISAVASVSGRGFPMVVDTPLGRLDVEHRKGVLRHLVERRHQVILLSTDTEVVGEYLDAVMPHVQKRYLVSFERVGEIGQSVVRPGYFESSGAE